MGGTKVVLVLVVGDLVRFDRIEAEGAEDSNLEVYCVVVVGLTSDFDLSHSVSRRLFQTVKSKCVIYFEFRIANELPTPPPTAVIITITATMITNQKACRFNPQINFSFLPFS